MPSGIIVSSSVPKEPRFLPLLLLVLSAQIASADALKFFNNWFVTGGHAVAGAGWRTRTGVGVINMTGRALHQRHRTSAAIVPCCTAGAVQAYPVAAFLYWQAVESTATAGSGATATFNGSPIVGNTARQRLFFGVLARRTGSNVASLSRGSPPVPADRSNQPHPAQPTARIRSRWATGSWQTPECFRPGVLGASLVVIYRVVAPGNPGIAPLRSVVIYDGAYTLSNGQPSMTQKIFGFYQAATNPAATMTHIVGNGQAAFQETLKVEAPFPRA